MKNFYFLAIFMFGFLTSVNAQFTDDIEPYGFGSLFTPRWTTWDGTNDGIQNAIVSDAQQFSGTKSIFIGSSINGQDAVLDLGGLKTTGIWTIQWKMYLPSGNTAYYNVQGNVEPSANDNLEFLSGNITLVGGTLSDDGGGNGISYPENEWFTMKVVVNLDSSTYELSINDASGGVVDFDGVSGLGGIDFFADVPTNTYFVDDVEFVEGLLGVDDFSADVFSVYPNPVLDVLNIKSAATVNEVVVYNVLGKTVLQSNPNRISPSIDFSELNSGAYLVKISINNSSKTIKVLK